MREFAPRLSLTLLLSIGHPQVSHKSG